ncbi:MAG: WYL domain-containing protein [Bacteroidaceae bacterium]|nr:WYL domain-containing protein [Bacteroidaceae bacterium]
MANVKNGTLRESIIDRCLQSRNGYSTKEMFDKCNDALERHGEMPVTALNTIRNDITSIANRWKVRIEELRNGREKKYRYEDPNFSIYNTPLNDEEIAQLSQAISVLQRFEGIPSFEWVEEMSAHLQTTVSASPEPVIGFDENKELKGMSFFTPLFKSITSKKTVKISYRGYKSDRLIEAVIHPYYLKEYNQRWFLFALNDNYKTISNFALDRIESIEHATTKYLQNTSIDFAHYFDNIVGVSVNPNEELQTVNLWVAKEQLPYTLSKPIHKTQQIIEEREDGSAVIAIKVIPNFELQQLLLSFGDLVEVLSPKPLREEIYCRIKNNLRNYK